MKQIALSAAAATTFAAELPIREVVLYKHGVGFFERAGDLKAGESARLDFKPAEMNDVLKSLTLRAQGGKVAALRYDSSEPLDKRLQEFPFQMGSQQSRAAFLDQFKGTPVEVRLSPADTVTGVLLGSRGVPASEGQPASEQLTLLLPSGEIRTVELTASAGLRFLDAKLQEQLRDYLASLAQSRSRDRRSVYIDSTDAPTRQLTASYLIPAAVWKSSYRLLLPGQGRATLEGWAIVDNTTGDDWTSVRLAVVSGKPISFISQLYEPRYRQRPVADLAEDQAERPVVYAGTVGGNVAITEQQAQGFRMRKNASAMAPPPPPAPMQEMASDVAPSSTEATAVGRETGELFEYRFPAPVTVRKGESAMLPFLQQELPSRRLLIFRDAGSPHPQSAVELDNATGMTLDGGPITVYDAGSYAGEALVETLKAGDKRLVAYAVDLGTRITTRYDSGAESVQEVSFRRGVLVARGAVREQRTYTIRNVDAKAKALLIEHPARPGFRLVSPQPAERTTDAYRFEVKLTPAAEAILVVVEERNVEETIVLSSLTPDLLSTYLRNPKLTPQVRQKLERIAAQKLQLASVQSTLQRKEAEAAALAKDQDRLRRNIDSLRQVPGQQEQVSAYARLLGAQETRLVSLGDEATELRKRQAALDEELKSLIESE